MVEFQLFYGFLQEKLAFRVGCMVQSILRIVILLTQKL